MKRSLRVFRRQFGHTLLEMLLSLVLLSVVMASVGSAVMFASHAVPDEDSAASTLGRDSEVLRQIAEDIANARYIIEQSANAITIVVRDRTGDKLPDRIRYAWSGKTGDALFYQLNDETQASLIDSVAQFDLSYETVMSDRTAMGKFSLAGETEITKFDNSSDEIYSAITSSDWLGQVITPALDADIVSFKITEIELYGNKSDGLPNRTDPAVQVEVHGYDADTGPDSDLYATGYLERQDIAGSMKPIILQTSQMILVGQDIALACYRDAGILGRTRLAYNLDAGGGMLTSSDTGKTWSHTSTSSLLHKIKASRTKQDKGYELQRTHYSTIRVSLMSDAVDRSPLTRLVRLFQAPQFVKTFWEADFNADPTLMDLNGDGEVDWSYRGGAVPDGSLVDGQLTADRPLSAQPMLPFTQMVTADIRMQSETGEGPLVYGPNRLDKEDDMKDPFALITQLRQDGAGGQELLFYNDITPTTPIARINGLPQGWIDLRLVLLPDDDCVSIYVNGMEAGTLELSKVSDDYPEFTFALGAAGSDAMFRSVRVNIGGTYTQMDGFAPIGGYALELIK